MRTSRSLPRPQATGRSALALLTLLLTAGCSDEAPAPPASAPTSETASAPAQDGVATTIHLEITGGPHAGTYDVTSERVTCSDGVAGEGVWGNQFYEPDEEALTSLQLIVPDADNAADGTDTFNVGVDVGGASYRIETRPGASNQGSGTVTVHRTDDPATVELDVRTDDGVAMRGTITCHQVMRL